MPSTEPGRPARVVIAPDGFKGTIAAAAAARAIARGWASVRPDDVLVELPMADGGEGTLATFQANDAGARRVPVRTTGPTGRCVDSAWLLLEHGGRRSGVVELASTAGIELLEPRERDPLGATSTGFGEAIRAALDAGVDRLILGIGSSASSDGGAGMLTALGGVLRDAAGRALHPDVAGIAQATAFDRTGLRPLPPGGAMVLTDVRAPLLGPGGAAAVFGPQKGAGQTEIGTIERALASWATVLGADPTSEGAGAAGGVGFALTAWGAELVGGADAVADLVGLDAALADAHVVLTGEGSFDAQSGLGKATGAVRAAAVRAGVPWSVVAGRIDAAAGAPASSIDLTVLAGSPAAAMTDAERWLVEAGAVAARAFPPHFRQH